VVLNETQGQLYIYRSAFDDTVVDDPPVREVLDEFKPGHHFLNPPS
jgi:hypothetical protein